MRAIRLSSSWLESKSRIATSFACAKSMTWSSSSDALIPAPRNKVQNLSSIVNKIISTWMGLIEDTHKGLPNFAMKEISLMSFIVSSPGLTMNLGMQSKGVSVIGGWVTTLPPRMRADFARVLGAVNSTRLEFVDKKMTKIGEARKRLKHEHKWSYNDFSSPLLSFTRVREWASSK